MKSERVRNVLFVCTGNTCRSPMAAGFFRRLAEENGLDVWVRSAGLSPSGSAATPEAVQAAEEYGVDLREHRPQWLDKSLVDSADLILTMTQEQKTIVQARYPNAQKRTFSLLEFIGETGSVADPWGKDFPAYAECANRLWDAVNKLVGRLAQ